MTTTIATKTVDYKTALKQRSQQFKTAFYAIQNFLGDQKDLKTAAEWAANKQNVYNAVAHMNDSDISIYAVGLLGKTLPQIELENLKSRLDTAWFDWRQKKASNKVNATFAIMNQRIKPLQAQIKILENALAVS